ncbi:MAG: dihydroorotate dehydrogenase (quinone) [Candidatus Mesenet longicola]|uniref:Dihydroorotate dehydrogenase (quinone) n=1 Tax=Candidatus Mesenet longicola TaxID=1892558 RepID=A0A8J3HWU9_9RICK|nr:MAG: dihydroorotate dehydrogenase (quinone) [Candidatus Mesenet longicola]GHM59741.1 MAG: dihydroorotate dehydrogenase (quinone) [Candidatus Mesenet longicola]
MIRDYLNNLLLKIKKLLKNPLFIIPPEVAHTLTIFTLRTNILDENVELPKILNTKFFNNIIRTPLGLAAGFDKNAEIIKPMLSLGFGFTEVGTVTKKPQCGNKKPRIFRLTEDEAVINSLGFNNKGVNYLIKQIDTKEVNSCVFGINIGKNSNAKDQISDYVDLIKTIYGFSDYITLNISSPNTPNLRDLHNKEQLSNLLQAVISTRKSIDYAQSIPIMLKISPDIDQETKENIAELILQHKIDGLIVGNTTVGCRDNLQGLNKKGGLSGKPLFKLSTQVLSDMYKLTKGKVLLIGCGGVSSGMDAYEKIKSGASLVQLYTAIVYHGFKVINKINLELAELLERDGLSNVSQAVGCIHDFQQESNEPNISSKGVD